MKKSKFLKTLTVFGTALAAPLLLTGCMGSTENNVDFRVYNGYIQTTTDGTNWENLVDLDTLKGLPGDDGIGIDGREVEFQTTEYYIQWRYKTANNSDYWRNLIAISALEGEEGTDGREVEFRNTGYSIQWRYVDNSQGSEENWKFLISLTDIKGEDGADGSTWYSGTEVPDDDYEGYKNGDYYFHTTSSDVYKFYKGIGWGKIANLNANVEKVTVNFNVNLPEYMYEFDGYVASNKKLQLQTIDKGSWLGLENFEGTKLKEYFLGWFIGEGVDETKVTSYTSINANCTLTAKWDYDKIHETYTSFGVEFRDWLSGTLEASLTSSCGDVVHISKTHSGKTISLVNDFAYATNTNEIILPYTASTGYEGHAVNDSTLETWNNTKLEKVSWMEYNTTMGETPVPAKTIGRYSFLGCSALIEMDIPSHIKSIGNRAFENCTNLDYVDCGGVTTISDKAFYNCSSLESIDLWNVETIGEYAFYNCSSLKYSGQFNSFNFYITETIKEIGINAFEGCVALTTILLNSTDIANLTNNESYLFTYADTIMIRKSIETDETAYIDDSQGNFLRQVTSNLDSHDKLTKVTK